MWEGKKGSKKPTFSLNEKGKRNSEQCQGSSLVKDDLDGIARRSLNDPFTVKGLLIEFWPARGEDDATGSLQISSTRGYWGKRERLNYACLSQLMYDNIHRWSHASARAHPISLTARVYLMQIGDSWLQGEPFLPGTYLLLHVSVNAQGHVLHQHVYVSSPICHQTPPSYKGVAVIFIKKEGMEHLWSLAQKTLERMNPSPRASSWWLLTLPCLSLTAYP